MADIPFSPQQIEKLLAYAGQRLGTTPEQLKAVFQKEGLAGLAALNNKVSGDTFSPEETAKVNTLLQDKEKTAALINDPSVQQLLARLLGKG
jgi:hypothetical protein